ncbi:S-adenosyl-L-methionine-dependent methyltransferase [Achaetomium macrosporum]|uniref:S-adenosyl-L-methionine-dependent methyltransferase n=1 Tax=Achaetomium macrosporum TaxID=79813 RepID=A0AAN7CCC8_9PEZI|nr:S-adenosyl-L-methionine-dependent methyltransferase [Achaetomium macrosporum]
MAADSQTVPVDNTYREVVVHDNREFQRYALENGVYFAPVDDDEIDRLQYMHEIFNMMFDNRLIFPPLPRPRRILDCGYGSGAWAIDVAEQYPECEVIGIDVYPYPVPEALPPNLDFQVDDLNSPSTFPSNYFDLVHSRMMAGGIHADRWMNYLGDILRILRPGGWCQMVEIYFNAQSDNGTLTSNHALQVWSQSYMQSIQPAKDPRAPLRLQSWMTQAGFVEVESRLLTLPLSGWPTDPRDHAIGTANRANVHRLLSSLAVFPFAHALNMSNTDIQLLVAQARSEADNPAFKAVYVCIGRKPGSSRHHHGDSRSHQVSKGARHGDSRKRVRHG